MTYRFGSASSARLATVHPDLSRVMHKVIAQTPVDFAIISGLRGKDEQNDLVAVGRSHLFYPRSKHNFSPYSLAVDVAPYVAGRGLVWDDDTLWTTLYDHIMAAALVEGVRLVWGGNWSRFVDKPHFELNWKR